MKRMHELSGGAQSELAAAVSEGVWDVLRGALGATSRIIRKRKKDLEVDEDALRRNLGKHRELTNELFRITQRSYGGIPFDKLEECADELCEEVSAILKENPSVATAGEEGVAAAAGGAEAVADFSAAATATAREYGGMGSLSLAATGGGDDDQLMEESERTTASTPVVKPETLNQKASAAVWGVIKHLFPADATCADIDVDDETLLRLEEKETDLGLLLIEKVQQAYQDADIQMWLIATKHGPMTSAVMEVIKKHKKMDLLDEKSTQALAVAFNATYYGTADDKFEQHLTRCCEKYSANSVVYTAPYVTITQSSGFGKSRILYRLAQKLERQPDSRMRLLYICGRDIPGSTGFPVATPMLFEFIFPKNGTESIAQRLRRAFNYACAHWGSVQGEWNGVFSAENGDVSKQLASKLERGEPPVAKQTAQSAANTTPDNPVLVVVIDEARSLLSKTNEHGVTYSRLLRQALTKANTELCKDTDGRETKPVIFAVLVDTNSQIHDFVPPLSKDPSSRKGEPSEKRLFPPFVLTHTMDVFLKYPTTLQLVSLPISYKQCVLETNPNTIRSVLLAMGRPLWYTQFTKVADTEHLHNVLFLGGTKLLCGLEPVHEKSYDDETLHGVAALMCRLGLRPQSSSAFASKVVANFMAVLHAVNYTHDAHISGYISEPFLTFAATHMWYEHHPTSLTKHMLPQFRELLMQGVIDVGSIGEVVARIFLLLAIDAAIMKSVEGDAAGFSLKSGKHRFQGQFCAVPQLLAELDGVGGEREEFELCRITTELKEIPETAISGSTETNTKKRKVADKASQSRDSSTQQATNPKKLTKETKFKSPTDEQAAHFQSWMKRWEAWSVGFSHFVELTQAPTKETLWCMLGRRAAGVLPRGQTGADLIIPIFRRNPDDVSYMLVQVKNVDGQDNEFPHSALSHMKPSKVFKKRKAKDKLSDLSYFSSTDVIRVFIALRQSNLHGAQSYFIDGTGKGDDGAYTLCLRGVCKQPEFPKQVEPPKYWPFLCDDIWKDLMKLAKSAWWDPMKVIKADLKDRKTHAKEIAEELPDDVVEDAVRHTLEVIVYDAGQAVPDEEMKAAFDAAALQQSGDP